MSAAWRRLTLSLLVFAASVACADTLQVQDPAGNRPLRPAGMRFVAGKRDTFAGKYVIQWRTEQRSQVAMFRVVAGYPEPAMAAMNRVLDARFDDALEAYFNCADGSGGSGMDSMVVSSVFLDARFVSFALSSSWSCAGAAHPDFDRVGTTLDARTGTPLTQEDLLWFGSGNRPAPDTDAWSDYRWRVFGPAMAALMQRLHPEDMRAAANESDNGCDYRDPEVWSFAPWYMTAEGMQVGAYFARAMRPCDNPEWAVIPYRILQQHVPQQHDSALTGHAGVSPVAASITDTE